MDLTKRESPPGDIFTTPRPGPPDAWRGYYCLLPEKVANVVNGFRLVPYFFVGGDGKWCMHFGWLNETSFAAQTLETYSHPPAHTHRITQAQILREGDGASVVGILLESKALAGR